MAKQLFIAILSMAILLMGEICFSDIIYLKNGQKMEGATEETEEGVYVDGMLFTDDEIERIEREPAGGKGNKGAPSWYEKLLNRFGIRTREQIKEQEERIEKAQRAKVELEKYKKRLQRNTEVAQEIDQSYDAERARARRYNQEALSRARQSNRAAERKEQQRLRKMEQARKNFFDKYSTGSSSGSSGYSGWDDDSYDEWESGYDDDYRSLGYDDYGQEPYYDEEMGYPYYEEQMMQAPPVDATAFNPFDLLKSIFGQSE